MNLPDDLRYSKTHEWVRVDGDTATIGITDYAQEELGDIVFLELPEVGRSLQQEQIFGAVESVNWSVPLTLMKLVRSVQFTRLVEAWMV